MTFAIRTENPLRPESRALIEGSEQALREVYTADECFSFSPNELAHRNVQFLVARLNGRPVGCVALVDQGSYGEIKRLFVQPSARGHGIGNKLMQAAEIAARDLGLGKILLETGDKLSAAVALYQDIGYHQRRAFGQYQDLDCSLFLEKQLFAPVLS